MCTVLSRSHATISNFQHVWVWQKWVDWVIVYIFILEFLATRGKIVRFTNIITIPSTWSSVWCPLVILISNVNHASFKHKTDKSISQHNSRLVYAFVSGKRMHYLFHVSSISSVVRQLFPTFPAHKAGSSWPLRENTYLYSTRLEVEHDIELLLLSQELTGIPFT